MKNPDTSSAIFLLSLSILILIHIYQNEKPFERQKAGIPDPKTVSYYHNGTFQSVCHHYGAKAGSTVFQEAFERYKNNQEQFPASP